MIAYLLMFGIFGLIFLLILWRPISFKFKADSLGVNLSWSQTIGLAIRKTLTDDILDALLLTKNENLKIDFMQIETHKLAGGNPYKVVKGIVDNKKRGIEISFQQAATLDLVGREISLEEINRLYEGN